MKKRLVSVALVAALAAGTLAGCGSSSSGDNTQAAAGGETAGKGGSSDENITLRFAWWGGDAYRGYVVITTGLVNALGENKKYYQSIKQDERSINVLLNDTIEDVDAFIYDICWSLYELVNEYPDKKEKYQNWWRELFPIAYKLAEFFCKKNDVSFYEERKSKYLS